MGYTLHVVSHTHWDREWYLPFQQFRLRLVDLIDKVLDLLETDEAFRHFHLDSQTIVLEDYLQVRPQARARLEEHIRAGRLAVGPWYQLNDEFLTSGESTVRSLLIGTRLAAEAAGEPTANGRILPRRHEDTEGARSGENPNLNPNPNPNPESDLGVLGASAVASPLAPNAQRPTPFVGYLPDQFGNLGQMPQILRGFGIDTAIMGRGRHLVDDRKMEFMWEAPDGSRVLASLMAFWYNNAQRIPSDTDEAVRFLLDLRGRMAAHSASRHLLLMNGVDHLEAQPDVGQVIQRANQEFQRRGIPDRVVHSSLAEYVAAIQKELANEGADGAVALTPTPYPLSPVRGELREDRGGACLAGTLSTRMYLKQANHAAQVALEQYAERLSAFAMMRGALYPQDQLRYAWKLLMQNHPHDSICGCSTDQVHREMMPRFQQVEQIAAELTDRAMDVLSGRDRTKGADSEALSVMVFNTLNWERTDPVQITLEFPLGEPSRGNPQRDDSRRVRGFRLMDPDGGEVPFAVTGEATSLRQVSNPRELPMGQWVQRVAVEFVAGNVPACGYKTYTIKARGSMPAYPSDEDSRSFAASPVVFEDCGEVGDEYLHRKPLADSVYHAHLSRMPYSTECNAVRTTRTYTGTWMLPAAATPDLQRRSEEKVPCRLTTRVTRWAGVPRTEYETTFDNLARDHRLRVRFDVGAGWGPEPLSYAEGQFDVVARPLETPYLAEGAAPFHPQQFWTSLVGTFHAEDEEGSEDQTAETLTIINRGMPEYEVYHRAGGETALAITLLRCVRVLSGGGVDPETPTPEAQCPGEHTFHYARLSTSGDWRTGHVWKQAHQFNVHLLAVQCPPVSGRPEQESFIQVDPAELVVTAIKSAEDRDSIVVRFYNAPDRPVESGSIRAQVARRNRLVNLNEDPQEEWQEGGSRSLTVGPKKIVTVELEI